MKREWFDLDRRSGRVTYLHSRTRDVVERPSGMSDDDWAAVRSKFFEKFPRAAEIRIGGLSSLPVGLVPSGKAAVFAPGQHLSICLCGKRNEDLVRVAGVQMPLFGDAELPSYLLDDGAEMHWSAKFDSWMLKSPSGSLDLEIAYVVPAKNRNRKRTGVKRAA